MEMGAGKLHECPLNGSCGRGIKTTPCGITRGPVQHIDLLQDGRGKWTTGDTNTTKLPT